MADITINGRPVADPEDQKLLEELLKANSITRKRDIDENLAARLLDTDRNGRFDGEDIIHHGCMGFHAHDIQRAARLFSDHGMTSNIFSINRVNMRDIILGEAQVDPVNILRYIDLYKDQPYAAEVIEIAARKSAETHPDDALDLADNYKDQPYAAEVMELATRKLAEMYPLTALERADLYKDQPYAAEVMELAARKSAEINPDGALDLADKYKDQPFAKDVINRAVEKSSEIELWRRLTDSIRSCPPDAAKAVTCNPTLTLSPVAEVTAAAWEKIRGLYSERLRKLFSDNELKDFASFVRAVKTRYDIEFLERFRSAEALIHTMELRNDPSSATRETAILIFPKTDWNRSFKQFKLIDRMNDLGFDVLYYEVDSEVGAAKALNGATINGEYKARVVMLAGHGTDKSLAFGGDDLGRGGRMGDERAYIDTNDIKHGEIQLSKFIKVGGDLILASCSNGKGGERKKNNLANTIAATLPEDVTIHSIREPSGISNIAFKNGEIIVNWIFGDSYSPKGKLPARGSTDQDEN